MSFWTAGLFALVALLGLVAARPLSFRPPRNPADLEALLAAGPHAG